VVILAVNLTGREIARYTIAPAPVFEDTLESIHKAILEIAESKNLDPSRILGLGMSFPGVVDSERKYVEYAPNIGLRSYSFTDFEKRLGLELFLENEAITAALAHRFVDSTIVGKNFVYVSVAEGIGTGIFIDGDIYKSSSKKAGEFGHIKVADNGLSCKCGRADCWELYASKNALIRYYRQQTGNNSESNENLLASLRQAFKKGEAQAMEAVQKYTRYLFRGIETILLSLSPDEIIIGGDLGELMDDIVSFGVNNLKLNSRFFGYESVPIRVSMFRETGAILGSALLPLYQVYDQET
jgi:predicted NBD/HSP70 family sugar kinase